MIRVGYNCNKYFRTLNVDLVEYCFGIYLDDIQYNSFYSNADWSKIWDSFFLDIFFLKINEIVFVQSSNFPSQTVWKSTKNQEMLMKRINFLLLHPCFSWLWLLFFILLSTGCCDKQNDRFSLSFWIKEQLSDLVQYL